MDDTIDAIAPPWGGELAIEILPLLDYAALSKARPKWVFGFSDVSTVTAALSYRLDWATVHSSNLMDLVDTNTDALVAGTLDHLETPAGASFCQYASERHTTNWPDIEADPAAPLVGERPTEWKWLAPPERGTAMSGRLIGGCWDILFHLFNTPYLNLHEFASRFDEGVLLYLENVDMNPCSLVRTIHNMAFRDVFSAVDGLILGRSLKADP